MILFSTYFDGHREVWRAPYRLAAHAISRLERYAPDIMSNLSKSSNASYWHHVFVKIEQALIGICNLTKIQRQQMLVRKLVDHPEVVKHSLRPVEVFDWAEVEVDNSLVDFDELVWLYVFMDLNRVSILFLWFQPCQIYAWVRNVILEPDAAVHCINRVRPERARQLNCAGVDSCLVYSSLLCHRVCEVEILIRNAVLANMWKTHLTSPNVIDGHLVSISPYRDFELTLGLEFFCQVLLEESHISAHWRRYRNLKVEHLVNVRPLKLPWSFKNACPDNVDPNDGITAIVKVAKDICLIELDTEVLLLHLYGFVLTDLPILWKWSCSHSSLNSTGLRLLVDIVTDFICSMDNHIGLGKINVNNFSKRNYLCTNLSHTWKLLMINCHYKFLLLKLVISTSKDNAAFF